MGVTVQVLGILGYPLGHSLSPWMHNLALAHLGFDYHYVPFEVKPANLHDAVQGLKALGVLGVNVTIPHKVAIMPWLDRLSPKAALIGATNTVKMEGGELVGYNTDGPGFLAALLQEAAEDPKGKGVGIIGAGGAARAVAVELAQAGIHSLLIVNRTDTKAEALVCHLQQQVGFNGARAIAWNGGKGVRQMGEVDILINATSLGMNGEGGEWLSPLAISDGQLVCDLVYRPVETPLLLEAKRRRARTLDGLGMLLHQAALSFEIWTAKRFPLEHVRQHLQQRLGRLGE